MVVWDEIEIEMVVVDFCWVGVDLGLFRFWYFFLGWGKCEKIVCFEFWSWLWVFSIGYELIWMYLVFGFLLVGEFYGWDVGKVDFGFILFGKFVSMMV